MRKTLRRLLTLACLLCIAGMANAQTISGDYNVTGYLFHPAAPRAVSQVKTIFQLGPNTYQVQIADLPGFDFKFDIDASNHLVNWVPLNSTSAASGFMTADNPGNIAYPSSPQSLGYTSAVYNNTYDPATHTFYMHYGYINGGTTADQNTYNRQIYEKYVQVIHPPQPVVTSISPIGITEGTLLTINGAHFTGVTAVTLGSASLPLGGLSVTDSVITGTVGKGASGAALIYSPNGNVSTQSLTYTAPPIAIYPWRYVGVQGFGALAANVNISAGPNNVPYVVYIDILNGHKATVMKLQNGNWTAVGTPVSDGGCAAPVIVVDKSSLPWVAYIDSTNSNKITVKRFISGAWATQGPAGFTAAVYTGTSSFAMAIDTGNKPYVLIHSASDGSMNVLRFTGSAWANVGAAAPGFKSLYGFALTIDKTTNRPYIAGDDQANGAQVAVQKFDGTNWVDVGARGFTTGVNGVFYPDIIVDNHGNPFVGMQEDNGPEDASVYAYKNGTWASVGNKYFSNGHTYNTNLALDTAGSPSVLFTDASNYQQGTVMQPNPNHDGTWQTLGQRSFATATAFIQHSYIITANNTRYVAYTDRTRGNRVSVMQYYVPVPPVITSFFPTTAGQGDTITIKGQNFIGTTASSLGGVAVTGITVFSDTVALVVAGTGASGSVSITTPAGTATKTGFVYCTFVTPTVSITSNVASPICAGRKVTFTATAANAGTPVYHWYKKGVAVGINSKTYADSLLNNGDSVWCVITSTANCLTTNNAMSNIISYVVNPKLTPAVNINVSTGTSICSGTVVTFTAAAVDTGAHPTYQWKRNKTVVGTNNRLYKDSTLATGDSIYCILTVSEPCTSPTIVTSAKVKFVVTPSVTPAVSIAANIASPICKGTKVTFTATVTNGGAPVYQWYKNNSKVGTGLATYADSLLKNSDSVWCVVTVNAACSTLPTVKSNVMVYTVNPVLALTAKITASAASPICAGRKVTFTATAPATVIPVYQWKKNNVNVGANSTTYADSLLNNSDSVWCIITGTAACVTPPAAQSNVIAFVVNPKLTPSITIQASVSNSTAICTGTSVTFTATAAGAGANPTYQWKKNGVNVGTNSTTYVNSSLANNDTVYCTLTATAPCASPVSTTSAKLKFAVATAAPLQPSAISGIKTVTANQANISYAVSKVANVGYTWVVPSGVTIVSGQGTSGIVVNWGTTAGVISVTANNGCGTSPASQATINVAAGLSISGYNPKAALAAGYIKSYPNPVVYTATVEFGASAGNKYEAQLVNSLGQVIASKSGYATSGINVVSFDMSRLTGAMYYVRLIDKESGVRVIKFVKAK